MRSRMPKEIAARRVLRRWLSPMAIALTLIMAAGCATMPTGSDLPSDGRAAPIAETAADRGASIMTRSGPALGLGETIGVRRTTGAIVDDDKQRRLRDSRLQRRERTIEGRIGTIDRQLDTIDMRRRQRLELEPHYRNRAEPREVLLEQEQRGLQFERRSVQREQNRLDFERRVNRSPRDPFTNTTRFPSRSIIQQ
jgi:hypothetical protein